MQGAQHWVAAKAAVFGLTWLHVCTCVCAFCTCHSHTRQGCGRRLLPPAVGKCGCVACYVLCAVGVRPWWDWSADGVAAPHKCASRCYIQNEQVTPQGDGCSVSFSPHNTRLHAWFFAQPSHSHSDSYGKTSDSQEQYRSNVVSLTIICMCV
jgi:hypothetical protein